MLSKLLFCGDVHGKTPQLYVLFLFLLLFINDEDQDIILLHTIRYSNPYLNDIFLVVRLTLAEGGIGGGMNEVRYRSSTVPGIILNWLLA